MKYTLTDYEPGVNPQAFHCFGLPFINNNNAEAEAIGDSTYIDCGVTLVNSLSAEKKAVMLVGIYDDQKLLDVFAVKPENEVEAVKAGETVTLEKCVLMNDYPGMSQIKVMVWEGTGSMKPIMTKPLTITK